MTDFPTTYDKEGKEIKLGARAWVKTILQDRFDIGTVVDILQGDVDVTDAGEERPHNHLVQVQFGPGDEKEYEAKLVDGKYVIKQFEIIDPTIKPWE
jgi:hypothetical protein